MDMVKWEYVAKIGSCNLTVVGELSGPMSKPSAVLDAAFKQIMDCGVSKKSIKKIDAWPLETAKKP